MNQSLPIWNDNMLKLMDHCVHNKAVSSDSEFLSQIGFEPKNLHQVVSGKQGFTHKHFHAAAEIYNVDMNWFYGFSNRMRQKSKKETAMDLITDALMILKASENPKRK